MLHDGNGCEAPDLTKEIKTTMKKFLSIMLGLTLLSGMATLTFAQDDKKGDEKKMKKKGKKKKDGDTDKKGAR